MSQARLLFSEAWASIRMNLSTTFAATMTVLIGMCLLGLFIALGTWVLSWSGHVQRELQVHVYFQSNATQQQETAVQQKLQNDRRVKQVIFVSKAEAEAKMKKLYPQLYKVKLLENPLPDSFTVVPRDPPDTPLIGKDVQTSGWSGVDAVKWGSATAKRVLTIAKVISLVFLIAVILLVVASTLLIANTIRLSIFARRREIEVMKLVGATNWFIRGPFMLEGFLCGFVGSVLAVILLVLGKTIALPSILPHIGGGNGSDVHSLSFTFNALALLGTGLLLGAMGSGLTLRRFLQV
jgi:cell division transport system permease protein